MNQNIIVAIQNRHVLEFWYQGSSDWRAERRIVEPHLLGYNQTDTLTLSAWQTFGDDGKTGWRAFHVDKIQRLRETGDTFQGQRRGYNPNDTTMKRILARL